MKVKMKTTIAGPGIGASPGDEVEVENGQELIEGGYAVEIESATIDPPEKAVMPKARPKTTRRGKK